MKTPEANNGPSWKNKKPNPMKNNTKHREYIGRHSNRHCAGSNRSKATTPIRKSNYRHHNDRVIRSMPIYVDVEIPLTIKAHCEKRRNLCYWIDLDCQRNFNIRIRFCYSYCVVLYNRCSVCNYLCVSG